MDRRSLLTRVFKSTKSQLPPKSQDLIVTTLAPYSGEWTRDTAAHLLRRSTFGPTTQGIKDAEINGLDLTVSALLADSPLPPLPINFNNQDDPSTPIGDTWVGKPNDPTNQNLNTTRNISLNGWQIGLFNEGGVSITEKLVLFWHNHFVTSAIVLAAYNFHYLDILRRNATGNFRTLAEEITISPSMLLYLNGNENTREAPNENYARELLELFTIGKGDTAGPGDYTNYTEDDVVALAKSLTGWRSRNIDGVPESAFLPFRHDSSDKQLSNRFGNVVIQDGGENEYKDVIDIILQQEETARYICKRLYIWFVGSNIDSNVESDVIEPMAALMRDNNYEVKPAIAALLKSEHFYDVSIRGCMLNHPIDFFFKMFNTFEVATPDEILSKYRVWVNIYRRLLNMDMVVLSHPSVAGWKAFYQGPQYYDVWANSVSLPLREGLVDDMLEGSMIGQQDIRIDTLMVVSKFNNPGDPNELIIELSNLLFPFSISPNQSEYLKNILIPGLPDFEWTVEYGEYIGDPDDDDKRLSVENKLVALFGAFLKMPENYLI
ncbi:MAG: hypothetical protein ACJA1A_003762 [Saprospiraceae bacterium]|jgi:hypothetical protein